ncbi:MAG: hypothetical protein KJO75_20370, partial [Dactylosporangium sp.]|nr:hypothetical protein [Dactylosporangium sp.]
MALPARYSTQPPIPVRSGSVIIDPSSRRNNGSSGGLRLSTRIRRASTATSPAHHSSMSNAPARPYPAT